jgi:hypothetical protein
MTVYSPARWRVTRPRVYLLYVAITATSRQWCAFGLVGCDVSADNSHVTLLVSFSDHPSPAMLTSDRPA